MPKELNPNAKKWVEALRSGEFKQGMNYLKQYVNREPKHCCLGVLCELYAKENGDLCQEQQQTKMYFDGSGCTLPIRVQHWIGLEDNLGRFSPQDSLSQRNDQGRSFSEIADIIESMPPGLFVEGDHA